MLNNCSPICHYYSYETRKQLQRDRKEFFEIGELQTLLEDFKKLRSMIFELRMNAEEIDLSLIPCSVCENIAEFNLIFPVIKKLSDAAEFINDREYREWQLEVEKQEKRINNEQ